MEAQIIKYPAVEAQTVEQELEQAGSLTVADAKSVVVSDQAGYESAAAFLREVKSRSKQVTEYWASAKQKAYAAHQEVVAKEKAMLNPLQEAEAIVKRTMTAYQQEMERQRRLAEAEARRLAQEERERLLAAAVAAETTGDAVTADVTLAMASMVEDMPVYVPDAAVPKVAGISTSKVWKDRIINPDIVPISANGMEIRPIKQEVLNSIARLTKGTATIPGVELYEDLQMSARA